MAVDVYVDIWLKRGNLIRVFVNVVFSYRTSVNLDYWQKCTQAPSPSTSLNVNNLIEGRSYDFRIMAVNDAGDSVPALMYSLFS